MQKDVMHFFNTDVKSVYMAYLAALQNQPFEKNCMQQPYHTLRFNLGFSLTYNMNGGTCTVRFMPYYGGTAVDVNFSIMQLIGARYEAFDRQLTDRVIDILCVPVQALQLDVKEFQRPENQVVFEGAQPSYQQEQRPPQDVPPTMNNASPVNPWQQPGMEVPTPTAGGQCKKCGATLLPNAKFCSRCGASTEVELCKVCGRPLLPNARFCSLCGQKQ